MDTSNKSEAFPEAPLPTTPKHEKLPPVLSVIIVLSRQINNLPGSVQSILSQNFTDIELILVNCGDINALLPISDLDDARLLFLHTDQPIGEDQARNLGIQRARGKYIAHLNAGEIYSKDHLDILMRLMQIDQNGKTLQVLTAQLSEKNQKQNALLMELARMKGSSAWRLLLLMRQLRVVIAPRGSLRSRLGGFVLRGFRFQPKGNPGEKQAVKEILSQIREKDQAMQVVNLQLNLMEQALENLLNLNDEGEEVADHPKAIQLRDPNAAEITPAAHHRSALPPEREIKPEILRLFEKTWETMKTQGLMVVIRKTIEYRKNQPQAQDAETGIIEYRPAYQENNKKIFTELVIQFLSLKLIDDPLVSIIIPIYNHLEETMQCLLSILTSGDKTKYEIILADDGSNDDTQAFFPKCQGLQYIRNTSNLGFLKNCNNAATFARGNYVLLLNNDVSVLPGWLDSLVETFANYPDTGLVGSKLLFPDGSLQEAGGVIWEDGTGMNYGKWDDPHKPEYNYLREVDYSSGACIMIPRTLWNQLGGFDELFAPAYYEDTDLAFRIRQIGYKVRYQPFSQLFHIEGASSGTDINSGVKKYQEMNRQKFVTKWKDVLNKYGKPGQIDESLYRDRSGRRNCLYLDASTPTPDQDSGSIDAYNFIKILIGMGFNVTFIPENLQHFENYTNDLQRIGVACYYDPYLSTIKNYIKKEGKRIDLVLVSRVSIAAKYIDFIHQNAPQAKIIFNTVDLHFLREERAAKLSGSGIDLWLSKLVRNQELSVMRKADQTILVSDYEFDVISACDPTIKKMVIPIPRETQKRSHGLEGRSNILFLGGFNHPPNIDGIQFFVNEAWPLIKSQLPEIKFLIGGSNMPEQIKALASNDIEILGYVSNLEEVYSQCLMSIAPLRYGAGVKGKVVISLGYGVPCVATSIATEGMGLENGIHIMVADTPDEFASAVVRLYNSPDLWEKLSENGMAKVQEKFSFSSVQSKLQLMLKEIGLV